MTTHEAQQELLKNLPGIYDSREAANIADLVLEQITGWRKIDRIINKQAPLLPEQVELLQKYTNELLAHKPIQYVLQEAWFCGIKLYVNESVLIPRPETEELVEWVMKEVQLRNSTCKILDVGTGSGCIPIVLKKDQPGIEMYCCDVSEKALAVARKNAAAQQTAIHFLQLDFLDRTNWSTIPAMDIIVSNPPYIPQKDKSTMAENVLQYEPHLALFVENDDPLLFYKAIAEFAQSKLLPGGSIFAEIHEDLGEAVRRLFITKGFASAELKKDMQGKDRMIKVS
jgi:release factor glutamine methyltransferase